LKYVFDGPSVLSETEVAQAPNESIQDIEGYYPDGTMRYSIFVGKTEGFGIGAVYEAISYKDEKTGKREEQGEWGVAVRYNTQIGS
jgi:hypothetical protein